MTQMLWGAPAWENPAKANADKYVGARASTRGVSCFIGVDPHNEAKVRDDIEGCIRDGAAPVPWIAPLTMALDAGTVDFERLPDHPSVTALVKILESYPDTPMLARLLFEFANVRMKDGKALVENGKPLLRYKSPATFRATFEELALKLPKNVTVALSYGPNGWPIDFAEWMPANWSVADLSLFGRAHRSLNATAGKNAQKFFDACRAAKGPDVPFIVGECGFPQADYAGLTGEALDKALLADAKALLGGSGWLVQHRALMICGPFASTSFNQVDWTTDATPMARDYIAKQLGKAATLPLPAAAKPSPLVMAGLV